MFWILSNLFSLDVITVRLIFFYRSCVVLLCLVSYVTMLGFMHLSLVCCLAYVFSISYALPIELFAMLQWDLDVEYIVHKVGP